MSVDNYLGELFGGETKPAALIIDASDPDKAAALVASITASTGIAPDHIILVAPGVIRGRVGLGGSVAAAPAGAG